MTAAEASRISDENISQLIDYNKKFILNEIKNAAYGGRYHISILREFMQRDVYDFLEELGYTVGARHGYYIVKWGLK